MEDGHCVAELIHIVVVIVVCSLLILGSISLHTLFIVTILQRQYLQTISNKLLIVLSCVDLAQALCSLPAYIAYVVYRFYILRSCPVGLAGQISHFIGYWLGTSNIIAIFVIAFEQYAAILYPYRHSQSMTLQKMLIMFGVPSLISCILSVTFSFVIRQWWLTYLKYLAVFGLALFSAVGFFYARIFIVVKRVVREISRTNRMESMHLRRKARAVKTSVLVLTVFVLCYMPFGFKNVLQSLGVNLFGHKYLFALQWFNVGAYANVLTDCIVYFLRMKSIRRAASRMMGLKRKDSRNEMTEMKSIPDRIR